MWRHTIFTICLQVLTVLADFHLKDDLPEGVQAKYSVPEQTYQVKLGQPLVVVTADDGSANLVCAIKLHPEIENYISDNETLDLIIKYKSAKYGGYKYTFTVNSNLPKKGYVKKTNYITLPNGKTKKQRINTPIFQLADSKNLKKTFDTENWQEIQPSMSEDNQKTIDIRIVSDGYYRRERYGIDYIYAETYDVNLISLNQNGENQIELQDSTQLNAYETECKREYVEQDDGSCKKFACDCPNGESVGESKCSKDNPEADSCKAGSCDSGYYFIPSNSNRKSKKGRCEAIPTCTATQHLVPQNLKRGQFTQTCEDNICDCNFITEDGSMQVGQVTDTCLTHLTTNCQSCGNGHDETTGISNTLNPATGHKGDNICKGYVCYCPGGTTVDDATCNSYYESNPSSFKSAINSHSKNQQLVLRVCAGDNACQSGFHLYNGDFATEISEDPLENKCYSNDCRCPEYGNRDSKDGGSCPRFGGQYCTKDQCANANNKKYRLVKLAKDENNVNYGYCDYIQECTCPNGTPAANTDQMYCNMSDRKHHCSACAAGYELEIQPGETKWNREVVWEPRLICVKKFKNPNEIALSNAQFTKGEVVNAAELAIDDNPYTIASTNCDNNEAEKEMTVEYTADLDTEAIKIKIYPRACPPETSRCDYYHHDTNGEYDDMEVEINGHRCHKITKADWYGMADLAKNYDPIEYECGTLGTGNQITIKINDERDCMIISKIRAFKMNAADLTPTCPCSNGTPDHNYGGTKCEPDGWDVSKREACGSCDAGYRHMWSGKAGGNYICRRACVCPHGEPGYNYIINDRTLSASCDDEGTENCESCDEGYKKQSYYKNRIMYKCVAKNNG